MAKEAGKLYNALTDARHSHEEADPCIHVNIYFGTEPKTFAVQKVFLEKCSNLPPHVVGKTVELHLGHIPKQVGHVLLHHLPTGAFEWLKPEESTVHENLIAELTTCVQVYAVAQTYELPSLAEQAKAAIKKLGKNLPMIAVLSALHTVYPNSSTNDTWLCDATKDQRLAEIDPESRQKLWSRTGKKKQAKQALGYDEYCRFLEKHVTPEEWKGLHICYNRICGLAVDMDH